MCPADDQLCKREVEKLAFIVFFSLGADIIIFGLIWTQFKKME